jgi:predicted HNH restriction endonuclease
VIALCPNCHRRAHFANDTKKFNQSLVRKLRRIEPKRP